MRRSCKGVWRVLGVIALMGAAGVSWAAPKGASEAAVRPSKSGVGSAERGQALTRAQAVEIAQWLERSAVALAVGDEMSWRARALAETSDDARPYLKRYLDWVKRYDENVRGVLETPMPGTVTSFWVSVPYESTSMADFRQTTPVETRGVDTAGAPEGTRLPELVAKYPQWGWMPYESTGNMGAVLPHERVGSTPFVALYLVARVVYEGGGPVRAAIEIPATTPVVAWLNGARVVESYENGPEEVPLYGDRHEVEIKPGENLLVLKVASHEVSPEFYVFLTDADTGRALEFRVENGSPISTGPLGGELESTRKASPLRDLMEDEATALADRVFLSRVLLPREDAQRRVTDMVFADIDATAALPPDALERVLMSMEDPGKRLQLVRRARALGGKDARLDLWYAREMLLNSEAQGDTGSRFVDEWPELHDLLSAPAPTVDGVSYEPLRQKMLALAELNGQQAMTALAQWQHSSDGASASSVWPMMMEHLDARGRVKTYREGVSALYEGQQNAALYRIELLDRPLRRAVSSGDEAQIDAALADIQKGVASFLALHPYDDYVWSYWIDILTAYRPASREVAERRARAGFTAEAESALMAYVSQRVLDVSRWQRLARYFVETGQGAEAVEIYDTMLPLLAPEEESFKEISAELRRMYRVEAPSGAVVASSEAAFETPYILEDIPGNADPDASQVVSLLDNRVVKILPGGLSSTFNQIVFEIVDEQGLRVMRAMPVNYAPSDEKLEILSVKTTKKDGSVRHLYHTTEYNTADESIRMYYDQRQVVIEVPDLSVGDRVEYRIKRTQVQRSARSVSYFSDIYALRATFPRQWSRYTIIAPESMPVRLFRHDPSGASAPVAGTVRQDGAMTVTTYEERSMPRLLQEDRMPGVGEVMPLLLVSSFDSWQSVADWFLDLSKEQWKPDEAIKNAVATLTRGVSDPLEKLKRIHSFVVKSTRYVALEFGIHGHKPYPVSQVFERRFGDCKDKASLLKVMLEEAGIETDFVLVRTRQNGDISMDMPNAYVFDHAIVYVPEFDLFLDGTAEFSGTRELPAMDQDAWMFIVKDDGRYSLRKSPVMPAESNLLRHRTAFDLTRGERVPFTDHASYSGVMAPSYRERYQVASLQKERLISEYAYMIPGTEISSYEFSDLTDLEQDVNLSVKAETSFDQIVRKDGEGWLVRPGVTESTMVRDMSPWATRRLPLSLYSPMTFEQTVELILPPGSVVTSLPEDQHASGPYGSWSIASERSGDVLRTHLKLSVTPIRVSAEGYPGYQDFLQTFDRAANAPYRIIPGS